jgi:hypothetical protein
VFLLFCRSNMSMQCDSQWYFHLYS